MKRYSREYWRDVERRYHANLKRKVVEGYGGKCYCCGESNPKFLTIDHVDGDGEEHRKELAGIRHAGNTRVMYRWIIKHNFPSTIQLACYNCNFGKQHNNNVCPHLDSTSATN
jgi:rubrerythrin